MAGFGFSPGTMSAYRPTLRDRAATSILDLIGHGPVAQNLVTGALGSRGLGTEKLGIADFIPGVGQAFQADEAGRQMASGHPVAGAANLALAAIPVPAAASAAKSAFGFAGKPVARALEGVGGKAVAEAAQVAASDAGKAAAPIIAYHGSPHAFDKFDTAKIGTGEGAQVYGHGLYFAENEKTAKSYRDALKWRGTDWGDPESVASFWVQNRGGVAPAKEWLQATANSIANNPSVHSDPAANKAVVDALELLNNGYTGAKQSANPGSMYQVGINAHPDHFLDWDKPLSEQHPKVRDAVQALGLDVQATVPPVARGMMGPAAWDGLRDPTGRHIYTALSEASGRSAQDAASVLQGAGIPGIKYLDQGSRTAGDGTRNYVVFDPQHIDILKRYGIPATVMGGAGAAVAGAQQQQQPQGF